MTITFLAPDGVPVTAQQERQARAVLYGAGSGRPLGARSGFRPGTAASTLTATSSTWTLAPASVLIDPGAATHQGGYPWASDANITGSVTAANATYARKDIVYIRVNDSSSGDGSGATTAPVLYAAGTPAASPVAPALPSRSFLLGTITVPKSGGGSPTVVLNPARAVAAGAPVPVADATERDALTSHDGLTVRRLDVPGRPLEVTDGALWYREGVGVHLEVARTATANIANSLWGPGTPGELGPAVNSAASRNASLFTFTTNNQITVTQAGIYAPSWAITDFSAGATGFMIIRRVSSGQSIASQQFTATGDSSASRAGIYLAAGESLQFNFQTTTAVSCKHLITITKLG